MALFHRKNPDFGWTMHAPLADLGGPSAWLPAQGVFSPVAAPGHVVLRSRGGEVTQLTDRELARPSDRFRMIDLRRRHLAVAPQTVPTSEGVDVTITFVLSVRITDPLTYVQAAEDPDREVYLAAQIALRELIATTALDELIGTRVDLTPVAEAAAAAGTQVGLDVSHTVHLKDFSLPREIKAAVDQGIVDKLKAQADLERARTEVKVVRARMGTAKVLEQNPVLAKLALLEALPAGTTLHVEKPLEKEG